MSKTDTAEPVPLTQCALMTAFQAGRALGVPAFNHDRPCSPSTDPKFIELRTEIVESYSPSHAQALCDRLHEGWLRGWAEANVAAPVFFADGTVWFQHREMTRAEYEGLR